MSSVTVERGEWVPDAPSVSVVIPTHGMGWLEEALESVRAQTVRDYEIVVVDDASPVPVRPRERRDLVLIRHEPNSGPGGARNVACAEARGELVAFLDSDDLWRPTKLERQLAFHRRRPELVASGTELEFFDEKSTWPAVRVPPATEPGQETITFARLFYENCLCTSAVMLKRAVFARTPGMVPGRRMGEDYGLWLRVALLGSIGFLDEVLVERRVHAESLMHASSRDGSWAREELAIYDELLAEHPELLGEPFVRAALARLHFQSGYAKLASGSFAAARSTLAQSLRLNPKNPKAWLDLARASLHILPSSSRRV